MERWVLITTEEARRRAVSYMGEVRRKTETVGLQEALGRIAAADVVNTEDNPPFDRSTVDGFALCSADTHGASAEAPAIFEVTGEVRMGRQAGMKVDRRQAVRIPTGGMLPEGADAVVMQEFTGRSGSALEVWRPAGPGENVILRGDDAVAGSTVLMAGRRIGVPDLGVLASCGVTEVSVAKKPVVTVLTTGDEIVPPGVVPEPGQIRDVNSFTLSALAEIAGCEVRLTHRVQDSQESLLTELQAAIGESDVVLISGGSSVGDRDFTTSAVQALPGVKVLFHGVALKPGKPTLTAVVGETAVFGIPGHTVAAMTVFREIVEPALLAFQGVTGDAPRFVIQAELGAPLRPDAERDEIFRVRLKNNENGVIAWPLPSKSGLITTMTRAHGLVYTKAGQQEIPAGSRVEVQVLLDRVEGLWPGELR